MIDFGKTWLRGVISGIIVKVLQELSSLFSIGPVQGKLKLTYLFMVDIAEFCFKLFPSFSTISRCVKNFYKAQECKQWQRKFSFQFCEIEIFLFWLHDWPIAKAGTKKGGRNRVWQTTCGIHVDFRRNILNFQFACRFLQIAIKSEDIKCFPCIVFLSRKCPRGWISY